MNPKLPPPKCPHCQNEDITMFEIILRVKTATYYLCNVCSKTFLLKD